MLRITSLFLSITTPVIRLVEKILGINIILSETGESIITEDNLYIQLEDNTL